VNVYRLENQEDVVKELGAYSNITNYRKNILWIFRGIFGIFRGFLENLYTYSTIFRGMLVAERLSRTFTPKFLCHPIGSSFCFQDAQNLNQQRARDEPYYLWIRNNLAETPNLFELPVMCKHWCEQIYLNLGIWSKKKKLSTFTELGTFCTHMF
jgi:hypothetical protein